MPTGKDENERKREMGKKYMAMDSEKACRLADKVFNENQEMTTAERKNLWETLKIDIANMSVNKFIKKYSDPALDLRTVTEG